MPLNALHLYYEMQHDDEYVKPTFILGIQISLRWLDYFTDFSPVNSACYFPHWHRTKFFKICLLREWSRALIYKDFHQGWCIRPYLYTPLRKYDNQKKTHWQSAYARNGQSSEYFHGG